MSQTPDFVLGDDFARVLTETTMSLVCVLGEDGRILFFNEACERLTGFTRAEAVGRDARELVIPPEEAEAFSEVLAYIWKTGLASPQVGHWLTKDGGRKLVAWSNKLMPGEDGASSILLTAGIDLSAPPKGAPDRGAFDFDAEAKLHEVGRLAQEQRALRRVATLVASAASCRPAPRRASTTTPTGPGKPRTTCGSWAIARACRHRSSSRESCGAPSESRAPNRCRLTQKDGSAHSVSSSPSPSRARRHVRT